MDQGSCNSPHVDDTTLLGPRLDALSTDPTAPTLVEAYFDPLSGFAGHTFDAVGTNPPGAFSEGDLLAVSLLDVAFQPAAVRELLDRTVLWSGLLTELPDVKVPLWEATDPDLEAAD